MADRDTLLLAGSVRDVGELAGQLLIESSCQRGVEGRQRVVAGFGRRGVWPRARGRVEGEEVRRVAMRDGDDGVVHRGVHNREAARRMDGLWLSFGTDDAHQLLVPVHDDDA